MAGIICSFYAWMFEFLCKQLSEVVTAGCVSGEVKHTSVTNYLSPTLEETSHSYLHGLVMKEFTQQAGLLRLFG